MPKPEATAVEVPGGSEFDQAREETDPVVPVPDDRPEAETVGLPSVPDDAVEAAPTFDTSALEVPTPSVGEADELTDAPDVSSAPEAPAATEEARPEDNAGDLPVPEAPGNAPDAGDAAPAAVASPDVEPDSTAAPAAGDAPTETEIAALPDAGAEASTGTETGTAPSVTTEDTAPAAPTAPDLGEDTALPSVGQDSEASPRLPQVSEPTQPSGGDAGPEISTAPEVPAQPAAPEVTETETPGTDPTPSLLEKVETLDDKAESVETDRLPRIGDAGEGTSGGALPRVRRLGEEPASEPEEEDVVDAPEAEAAPAEGPAIRIYGTEFANPEGNPLLSLVLVQEGDVAMGEDEMAGLPPSVAVAIDAGSKDAGQLAAFYRAAGREVVMIPSLPQGAAPQDVEQALRVNFETLPEAVAIMDVSGTSFQSDRGAVQQVVDVASASGHGMITFPRGLNTAHQSAERAGVPAGLIFRRLDGGNEDGEQIRRALDRAAFRARPEEAVILVGSTAPATLAAIAEWASGNRAKSVTLAPISAALLKE